MDHWKISSLLDEHLIIKSTGKTQASFYDQRCWTGVCSLEGGDFSPKGN
jgi:hypothetical protein